MGFDATAQAQSLSSYSRSEHVAKDTKKLNAVANNCIYFGIKVCLPMNPE